MENSKIISKLPEELRAKYKMQARTCCDRVECLKVAAALKLWGDRGYRDIEFGVPLVFRKKMVFVDVLARNEDGVVGVVCMPSLHLGWLRGQVAQLRRCLPPNCYLVIVSPSTVGERVNRAAFLADEVWVTDKDNSEVASMMFVSVCRKG